MCQSGLDGLVQETNDSFAPATGIHTTVSREMHPAKAVQCLARPDMMALQRQVQAGIHIACKDSRRKRRVTNPKHLVVVLNYVSEPARHKSASKSLRAL